MRAHSSGCVTSFVTMREMQCAGVRSYILQLIPTSRKTSMSTDSMVTLTHLSRTPGPIKNKFYGPHKKSGFTLPPFCIYRQVYCNSNFKNICLGKSLVRIAAGTLFIQNVCTFYRLFEINSGIVSRLGNRHVFPNPV
jgi:hypothetical protein